jgi:hypothetical protein
VSADPISKPSQVWVLGFDDQGVCNVRDMFQVLQPAGYRCQCSNTYAGPSGGSPFFVHLLRTGDANQRGTVGDVVVFDSTSAVVMSQSDYQTQFSTPLPVSVQTSSLPPADMSRLDAVLSNLQALVESPIQ